MTALRYLPKDNGVEQISDRASVWMCRDAARLHLASTQRLARSAAAAAATARTDFLRQWHAADAIGLGNAAAELEAVLSGLDRRVG